MQTADAQTAGVEVRLSQQEARALARTVELARAILRDTLRASTPALDQAHRKLRAALGDFD